jgi:hypothetical protein
MATLLPVVCGTRIEIPKPVPKKVARTINIPKTHRSISAVMPRGATPAPLSPSREYVEIPRADRISLQNEMTELLSGGAYESFEAERGRLLIVLLKERKRTALLRGEYDISQKCEDLIRYIAGISLQRQFTVIKTSELSDLSLQLQRAEAQLAAIKNKWQLKVEEFNHSQFVSAKRLERAQLRKIQDFNTAVPTALPPEYCKLSPDLLNLREQERQLVLSRRYEEAKALKRESDRREKEEAAVQKQRFLELVNRRKEKILLVQRHEIDCFTVRWKRREEKLNQEMEAEIATQEKIIQNIKLKVRDVESEEIMQ